eukprot:3178254-Prorocentrum_lima.AAC.1
MYCAAHCCVHYRCCRHGHPAIATPARRSRRLRVHSRSSCRLIETSCRVGRLSALCATLAASMKCGKYDRNVAMALWPQRPERSSTLRISLCSPSLPVVEAAQ